MKNLNHIFEEVLKEGIGDGSDFTEEDYLDENGFYKEFPEGLCMHCNKFGNIVSELYGGPIYDACYKIYEKNEILP